MTDRHIDDELLSAHIDDSLSSEESARVAGHLFTCSACSTRVERLRATQRAVAGLALEEPLRGIDLAFTRAALPAPAPWRLRVLPRRVPAWAPPLAAAAVVAALAVGLGPALLRATHPGGGAATIATGGALTSRGADQGSPGTLNSGLATPSSATAAGTANNFAAPQADPGSTSSKSFQAAGGATVTLSVDRPRPRAGDPVQVRLTVTAGGTELRLGQRGLVVTARRGTSDYQLLQQAPATLTISPGQTEGGGVGWSAGATGGSPAPGELVLVGHVYLADGSVLEVSLPLSVN